MTNFTLGSTYRNGYIDVANEIIPQNTAFSTVPGESHVFEEREGNVSVYQITNALENGTITQLDKAVLSLVAVFGSTACTTKCLFEMLTLMGVEVNRNTLESSVKRLHRLHLVNFSRFKSPDGKVSNTRIITLMRYGSQLAKTLGVVHRFNPLDTVSAEASTIKSRASTTQLICNWLKNLPVESFAVRPVIVVNADAGAIIRPAASIDIWGERIYFESPRRIDGWPEMLVEKLSRYKLVFGEDKLPTVIINGEDAQMNLEAHKALKGMDYKGEILFTDDLSMFGTGFATCLYNFGPSDEKNRFRIKADDKEAV